MNRRRMMTGLKNAGSALKPPYSPRRHRGFGVKMCRAERDFRDSGLEVSSSGAMPSTHPKAKDCRGSACHKPLHESSHSVQLVVSHAQAWARSWHSVDRTSQVDPSFRNVATIRPETEAAKPRKAVDRHNLNVAQRGLFCEARLANPVQDNSVLVGEQFFP